MSTIVTRAGKGSALTHNEVDANFTNLNTDKVEKSGTDPVVISVNSSSNALRITQTGTGNCLVVEDSANPDATPFVIDASGNTIVGNTSPTSISGLSAPQFQVQGATTGSAGLSVHATDTTNSGGWQSAKARGTLASPTIVNSADNLGFLRFAGHDGTAYIRSAEIFAQVDGTPGTNDMPGRLVFSTTADGASTPTERMRIESEGRVDMRSNMTNTASGSASSISGTTLTVGGTITGAFNVGDRIFGVNVEANTFITALGTGTGGAGTYTINNSQTAASAMIRAVAGGFNVFRFTDTDTTAEASQPMGVIEWYGSDASTPGAGVKAYITAISENASPDTALVFGTSDNLANIQAVEQARITSTGDLRFNSGYGSVATAYGCRAWVNFDGTTSPGTIRASGNVSSVTRNSTGIFTINITTAMPDASYSVSGLNSKVAADAQARVVTLLNGSLTTTSFQVYTERADTGALENRATVTLSVFR